MIIGIDPDLTKSGVAILSPSLELRNLTFAEVVKLFSSEQANIKKVVIEAGWLNKKANHHGAVGQRKSVGEQIARRVGLNHATGMHLADMAESLGLKVVLVRPTRSKKNAEDFKRITGWTGRSNQETRDAAMLIWGMV
ncbi:hypothetical protein [Acinetobacter larvae]|uniref:Pre-16S rRNA nuclease n=1 Tax=Acinetobacter larvae TaxID=1789224 RepID=A0A1B2LZ54_9GAMM|nr:hypothetical protein [Acinetobacter larvae]AOA58201.1 hypothetical protein BFG52_07445 [Acinetobacter larvae]